MVQLFVRIAVQGLHLWYEMNWCYAIDLCYALLEPARPSVSRWRAAAKGAAETVEIDSILINCRFFQL